MQVSQAWISNCIPQYSVGCSYLSLPEIPASGATVLTCDARLYLRPDITATSLQWRHNARPGVSNHQPHDCLLNHLFRRRSKKTSKLRVTGLCAGNSPVTGEFPAQMAIKAENVSIWWRHHVRRREYPHPLFHSLPRTKLHHQTAGEMWNDQNSISHTFYQTASKSRV